MKHKKRYITVSSEQTKKIAKNLIKKILNTKQNKKALVLALQGDLGSGKTTFLQGFAKGLGVKEKVLSPTFILVKRFNLPLTHNLKFKSFYHIDCYRLHKPKEILDIGFKKIISNPENIVAIEWPEKIQRVMPRNAIKFKFSHFGKNKREITIK